MLNIAFKRTPRDKTARCRLSWALDAIMGIRLKHFALLPTLLIPSFGLSQSLGYLDADTPGEAVGMIMVSIQIAEVLRDRCIRHDPTLQEGIDTNLLKWRTTEQRTLKKAVYYWNKMSEKEPKMAETLKLAERAIDANLKVLSESEIAGTGYKVINLYCVQHFDNLASGVWRTRTPKAYAYMDEAPYPDELAKKARGSAHTEGKKYTKVGHVTDTQCPMRLTLEEGFVPDPAFTLSPDQALALSGMRCPNKLRVVVFSDSENYYITTSFSGEPGVGHGYVVNGKSGKTHDY